MIVNNMTTSSGKAIVVGTMGGEALLALYDLRWMLILNGSLKFEITAKRLYAASQRVL